MWYFAWVLGVGFAVLLAILNAMWGELAEDRKDADSR
jgi:cytochrome bd-I ubiquinol oxidase subunit X